MSDDTLVYRLTSFSVLQVLEDCMVCHKVFCWDGNQPSSQYFEPPTLDFYTYAYLLVFKATRAINTLPLRGA